MKFKPGDKVTIAPHSLFIAQNPQTVEGTLLPGVVVGTFNSKTRKSEGVFHSMMKDSYEYHVVWDKRSTSGPYYAAHDLNLFQEFQTNKEAKRLLDTSF